MNRWLDCVQILQSCSLGISDDLINFSDGSFKNKMAAATIKKNNWGGGVIIFFIYTWVVMDWPGNIYTLSAVSPVYV